LPAVQVVLLREALRADLLKPRRGRHSVERGEVGGDEQGVEELTPRLVHGEARERLTGGDRGGDGIRAAGEEGERAEGRGDERQA
jgi:hypothetical protein